MALAILATKYELNHELNEKEEKNKRSFFFKNKSSADLIKEGCNCNQSNSAALTESNSDPTLKPIIKTKQNQQPSES